VNFSRKTAGGEDGGDLEERKGLGFRKERKWSTALERKTEGRGGEEEISRGGTISTFLQKREEKGKKVKKGAPLEKISKKGGGTQPD